LNPEKRSDGKGFKLFKERRIVIFRAVHPLARLIAHIFISSAGYGFSQLLQIAVLDLG
jgi:hypothetical protein